jgi:hypothetical protein
MSASHPGFVTLRERGGVSSDTKLSASEKEGSMIRFAAAVLLLTFTSLPLSGAGAQAIDEEVAARLARLALDCVQREYPNKIAHVLYSDADAKPPRKLTPAFYGCYDWHSSVHGHWLLARLASAYPDAPFATAARSALTKNLTAANIRQEIVYIEGAGRASFERPYGLAWLLQLGSELREWDSPEGEALARNLRPLEVAVASRLSSWLPKLSYPVRSGEHSQTAFALGLILDWTRQTDNRELESLVVARVRSFYLGDRDCPLSYEPSGEDFVSPCLAEADVVRRVLDQESFAAWLGPFLPVIPQDGSAGWLQPAVVTDPTDGKLAHLDGLNLSRAWMLDGIASGLPPRDPRRPALEAARDAHRYSGLASVTGEHYEGGHWLGSFATYLVTRRGIGDQQR